MSILNAIGTLGQLQTFAHWLTEIEGEGVTSLARARELVHKEVGNRHTRKQRPQKGSLLPANAKKLGPKEKCPDCETGILEEFTRYEEQVGEDGNPIQVEIQKCEKCAFSRIKGE